MLLEGEDLGSELVQALEVVGGEQLALDDGEVDLDLVQPGGVNGQMNHLPVGVGVTQAVGSGPVAGRGSVVHDPENAPGRGVRLSAHDLVHERGERLYPGGRLAPAHHPRVVDIVGGQVGQGAVPVVFALGPHRPAGARRERQVEAHPGLDARFLVGAEDVLVLAK